MIGLLIGPRTPNLTRSRRGPRPRVEALEGRCLLSGGQTEFPLSADLLAAYDQLVTGPDGNLWTTAATYTSTVPNNPFPMVPTAEIVRISPQGGLTRFSGLTDKPFSLTPGPDGALWFTMPNANAIGRITTDGAVSSYPLPSGPSGPDAITAGPDGALWFTERVGNRIGRISTSGAITEFALPGGLTRPDLIVSGPDGALWFAEQTGPALGRIATDGTIAAFPIPDGSTVRALTVGPDHALWFTEAVPQGNAQSVHHIGRMALDGSVTEFALPAGSNAVALTAGSDGALWFTDNADWFFANEQGRIGRITTAGTVTETPLLVPASLGGGVEQPLALATGPDGALWFESYRVAAEHWEITRLDLRQVVTATGAPVAATEGATVAAVVATVAAPPADVQAGLVTATIAWGDGQVSAGTLLAKADGTYQVRGSNVYALSGRATVTVTIADAGTGGGIVLTSLAEVAAPPVPVPVPSPQLVPILPPSAPTIVSNLGTVSATTTQAVVTLRLRVEARFSARLFASVHRHVRRPHVAHQSVAPSWSPDGAVRSSRATGSRE